MIILNALYIILRRSTVTLRPCSFCGGVEGMAHSSSGQTRKRRLEERGRKMRVKMRGPRLRCFSWSCGSHIFCKGHSLKKSTCTHFFSFNGIVLWFKASEKELEIVLGLTLRVWVSMGSNQWIMGTECIGLLGLVPWNKSNLIPQFNMPWWWGNTIRLHFAVF